MDYSIKQLNAELEDVMTNSSAYHNMMEQMRNYYLRSAFYPTKSGERLDRREAAANNLLKVYADKNIHFTSSFPTIKVPTGGATPEERQAASVREKILTGTWRESGGRLLQRKWAFDGSVFSAAVAETMFDLRERKVKINRYDPRYCYWQMSNGNDARVIAFWAVYPITAEECKAKYGITPNGSPISRSALADTFLKKIDGKDWYLQATRWDANVRVAWVGDTVVEEPHNHMMAGIPVDICIPFDEADAEGRGGFYLQPMLQGQADLNLTLQQRQNIVNRMASPVVWGRGIIAQQFDDVKNGLKNGGFIGMKQGGELGILQLNDVKLLNEQAEDIRSDLQRMSGFSQAAMGELAGANTSGDALGMYFTPTQRHIENQNVGWISFYESINAKILRLYERFGGVDEEFSLSGFSSRGTLLSLGNDERALQRVGGAFDVKFTKEAIAGNYNSVVEMSAITPKNALEEKRLVVEAVTQGFLSRTTAYELYGLDSPEDELALLTQEKQQPALNPQGMQQIAAAASSLQSQPQPAPAAPAAVAQEIRPNVQPV